VVVEVAMAMLQVIVVDLVVVLVSEVQILQELELQGKEIMVERVHLQDRIRRVRSMEQAVVEELEQLVPMDNLVVVAQVEMVQHQ
jgi:hypothetical protein